MQRASIWRIMPILPLRLCVRVATALKLVNRSKLESTCRSFIGGLGLSEKTRTKSNLKQLGHGIGRIRHLDPERDVSCIVQSCLQNPHDLLNCSRFISMVLMCPRSLFPCQCKFSVDVQRGPATVYQPASCQFDRCCAIHESVRASRRSKGMLPPLSISSWNVRISNLEPSSLRVRSRSSRNLSWPIL